MIDFHSQLSIIPAVYETATLQDNLEHSGGISISWNSAESTEIPLGAYITYGGLRYILLEPYAPTKQSAIHYRYDPQFKHPNNLLDRIPFWITSKNSQQQTVHLRTTSFTGYPHTICQKLAEFFAEYVAEVGDAYFNNTVGTNWTFSLEGVDEHAIITVPFDGCTIKSSATAIATALSCNVYFDWNLNTQGKRTIRFIYGSRIDGDIYNCYHVLGGTTNMGKITVSGSYSAVTQRMTLPDLHVWNEGTAEEHTEYYPGSIIDRRVDGQGVRLITDLVFDDIYPKMELYIKSARQRLCYLTDEVGNKIVDHWEKDGQTVAEGTEGATAIYKTFAKWYIRLWATTDFDNPEDEYPFDPSRLINDKPLTLLFQPNYGDMSQTSPLVGRQFELTHFDKVEGTREWEENDVLPRSHPFVAQKDEYRIAFIAEGEVILPTTAPTLAYADAYLTMVENNGWVVPQNTETDGLIPKVGNKVTLINMALSDTEINRAKDELLTAATELIFAMEQPKGEYTETVVTGNYSIGNTSPFVGHTGVIVNISKNIDTGVTELTVGSWSRKSLTGGIIDKIDSVSVTAPDATVTSDTKTSSDEVDTLDKTKTKPYAKSGVQENRFKQTANASGETIGNPDSWDTTAPNHIDGQYIWMIYATKYLNGTYSDWQGPIRLTGDKGQAGEDGSDMEYIYILKQDAYPFPDNEKPANISTGEVSPGGHAASGSETDNQKDDWVPNGWWDNPQGISSTNKFEYMSWRHKPAGSNTWGAFSDPIVWGHWGRNGMDGDGTEYVYIRTKKNIEPVIADESTSYLVDEWRPYISNGAACEAEKTTESGSTVYRTTDDPKGTNETYKYEWVAKRNMTAPDASTGQRTWKSYWECIGSPYKMSLWGNYSENTVRLALDNQHEDFLYSDKQTLPIAPSSGATSPIHLYDGATEVTSGFTIEVDFTKSSGVPGSSDANKPTISNGVLTVPHLTANTAKVVVKATYPSTNGEEYYAEFTANKTKQDKYDLILMPSSIAYNSATFPDSVVITPSATRTDLQGNKQAATIDTTLTSGLQLFYQYVNSDGTLGNTTYLDTSTFVLTKANAALYAGVYFALYYKSGSSYRLCDYETVEIAKAENGENGRGITSTNIYYKAFVNTPSQSEYPSGAPGGSGADGWVDNGNNLITKANADANKHLYESTCTTYSNGTYSWTTPMDDGLISDLAATEEEFALADSGTTAPETGWASSVNPASGKWIWSRTKLTFKTGSPLYKYVNVQCVGYCGTDADVWTIGNDGYWYCNGVKTNTKAEGTDGTGVEIKGGVDVLFNADKTSPSQTSLEELTMTAANIGECYTVTANKHLYFYDNTTAASATNPFGWRDLGKFSGDDGLSSYMHIAYADDVTFDAQGHPTSCTGFTITKQKEAYDWIGLCTNNSQTDPTTYTAYEWNKVKGAQGAPGGNTATVYLYKRSASPISTVGIEITLYYKFQKDANNKNLFTNSTCTTPFTDQTQGGNGWSPVIPSGTDPIYVTAAIAYSANEYDDLGTNEWVTPVQYTENGAKGINTATVFLYQRSASAPTGTAVSPQQTLYYKFEDGKLYKNAALTQEATKNDGLNGWETKVPTADGNPCYIIQAAALSADDYDAIEVVPAQNKNDWSSVRKLVEDGDNGNYYIDQYGRASGRALSNGVPYGFDSTTGWGDSAPAVNTTYPYIWKRSRLWNPNTNAWADGHGTGDQYWSYVCETGEGGVIAIASPSQITVPCNADGSVNYTNIGVLFSLKVGDETVEGYTGTSRITSVTPSSLPQGVSAEYVAPGAYNAMYISVNTPATQSSIAAGIVFTVTGTTADEVSHSADVTVALIGTKQGQQGNAGKDAAYISIKGGCQNASSQLEGSITIFNGTTATTLSTTWESTDIPKDPDTSATPARGLALITINKTTLEPTRLTLTVGAYTFYTNQFYDTYYSDGRANALALAISKVPSDYFICLYSFDAIGHWTEPLITALANCGSGGVFNQSDGRYPFIFIGYNGLSQGFAVQMMGAYQASHTTDATVYVADGALSIAEYGNMWVGLKNTGIDIEQGSIELRADKVTFQNSAGSLTTPKISIDPTTGALNAVDGNFEGTVKANNLYHGVCTFWPSNNYIPMKYQYLGDTTSEYTYGEIYDEHPNSNFKACTGHADIINITINSSDDMSSSVVLPIPSATNMQGKLIELHAYNFNGAASNFSVKAADDSQCMTPAVYPNTETTPRLTCANEDYTYTGTFGNTYKFYSIYVTDKSKWVWWCWKV